VRRTKIVATIGPASRAPDILGQLVEAGVDVFRLNFSHGNADQHRETAEAIRKVARERGRVVGLLQDLQGPKIRVGRFKEQRAALEAGQRFTLTRRDVAGDREQVSLTYPELPREVRPGDMLLLDDGNIRLEVESADGESIVTRVQVGGMLSDGKGINLPGVALSLPALTDKDVADIATGAEIGVDWVAVSFVRTRDDVLLARHYLKRVKSPARLMAKIEKPAAVQQFDSILPEVDGIMVARGDLGVELPAEQVPLIQKRLIRNSLRAGKPVITATQMLESMTGNPRPTRAEASDVANAILDGTDAVMLSAETAVGRYPVIAAQTMARIAVSTEAAEEYRDKLLGEIKLADPTIQDGVALAAADIAKTLGAACVVTFTASGSTAWRVARLRPYSRLVVLTPNREVCQALALAWGVTPFQAEDIRSTDEMSTVAIRVVREAGIARTGEIIVITAGVPFGVAGTTNLIRVEQIP
jgi:pyruvate kinase